MAEKGRLLSGARVWFSIDGVRIGYARSVSIGESVVYQPVKVLGNVEIEEYVPTEYSVTFTASMFKIIGETVKSLGMFPSVGGNTEEHLENILISGDMTATLEDNRTGRIFATLEQVKVQSHNYTVEETGVVGEDVEFVAVRVRDESEV